MMEQVLWKKFEKTGKVKDYLDYIRCKNEEIRHKKVK
jgi:hypothetical protein